MDEVDRASGIDTFSNSPVNAPGSNLPPFDIKLEKGQDPEKVAREIATQGFVDKPAKKNWMDEVDGVEPEDSIIEPLSDKQKMDRSEREVRRLERELGIRETFISQGRKEDPSYLQRITRAVGVDKILGTDEESSERTKAARERASAHMEYHDISAEEPNAIELFARGAGNIAAYGLPQAVTEARGEEFVGDLKSTKSRIAYGAGNLAGFIAGGPRLVAEHLSKSLLSRFPSLSATSKTNIVPRIAKTLTREVPALATATTSAAMGEALSTNNLEEAFKVMYTAAGEGAVMGAAFGGSKSLFPGSSNFQRIKRIATGMAMLDASHSTHPFDERKIEEKIFGYGVDLFFLWHGLPNEQSRSLIIGTIEKTVDSNLGKRVREQWKNADAAGKEALLKKYVFAEQSPTGVGEQSPPQYQQSDFAAVGSKDVDTAVVENPVKTIVRKAVEKKLANIDAAGKPIAPLRPEAKDEIDPLPTAPLGEGWESDRGAMPGEPSQIYKEKAAIIENVDDEGKVLYEATTDKGLSLGIFEDIEQARKAAEYYVDGQKRVRKASDTEVVDTKQTQPVKEDVRDWMFEIDESAGRYEVPEENTNTSEEPTGVVYGEGFNDAKFSDMRISKPPSTKNIISESTNEFGLKEVHSRIKAKKLDIINLYDETGEIIGGISQQKYPNGEVRIGEIYLEPEYRGKGIAQYLYSKFPDAKPGLARTEAAIKARSKYEEEKQISDWKKQAEENNVIFEGVQRGRNKEILFPSFTGDFDGVRSSFALESGETVAEAIKRKQEQKKRVEKKSAEQKGKSLKDTAKKVLTDERGSIQVAPESKAVEAFFTNAQKLVDKYIKQKMYIGQLHKTMQNKGMTSGERFALFGDIKSTDGKVSPVQVKEALKANTIEVKDIVLGDPTTTQPTQFDGYSEPEYIEGSYRELFVTAPNSRSMSRLWRDGHSAYSSIQNPIVRIRFNERSINGKRVLFLEEVQGPNPENQKLMPTELSDRIYDIGIKKALGIAKAEGFDYVALTTGEMQAKRYDLSKYIEEIAWSVRSDGSKAFAFFLKTGYEMPQMTISADGMVKSESQFNGRMLNEIIGKDLASKVMTSDKGSLSGLNLEVGGEGLKNLYDVRLPSLLRKYGKGKIETLNILQNVDKTDVLKFIAPSDYILNESQLQRLRKIIPNYNELVKYYDSEQDFVDILYGSPFLYKFSGEVQQEVINLLTEDAIRKAEVKALPITKETPSSYTLYSGLDLIAAVQAVRKSINDVKDLVPAVERIGRKVFDGGKKEYFEWKKEVKFILDEMWDKVKSVINRVWNIVNNERGSFSWNQKTKAVKEAAKAGKVAEARQAIEELKKEYFYFVKGNKLDQSAMAYMKSGKFEDYIENMPTLGEITPKEVFKYSESARKVIATLWDKDGKIKPAIRKSGFHALQEFEDGIKNYKDIGKFDRWVTDPTRFIQGADQGFFGGMLQKHILWPIRSTVMARLHWSDVYKTEIMKLQEKYGIYGKKKLELTGEVVEAVETDPKTGKTTLDVAKVEELLKDLSKEEGQKIIDAAEEFRTMWNKLLDEQNMARAKRGEKPIPRRTFYRPHVMKINIWSKVFGEKYNKNSVMESISPPDTAYPDKAFNPRAEKRYDALMKEQLEKNVVQLMADYVDVAGKDIFYSNIIQNTKIHTAVMRKHGLENAANAVDAYVAEAYAGVDSPITRLAKSTVPSYVREPILKLRRNLTRAVFPLNVKWNMFIQTTSAGLTAARYGIGNSIKGLQFFTDSALRSAIDEVAYSKVIKERWVGSMAYQDLSVGGLAKMRKLEGTKIDTAEHYANFLTRSIENGLTGHAIVAAYSHGKKLGLTGRALWEYASEGGAKTQSMYNPEDSVGLLRAREVGALAPFQTFAFEMFNSARELNIPGINLIIGKTGAYETIAANSAQGKGLLRNRMKILALWFACALVTNAVVDEETGRKPWDISSFIPFYGVMSGLFFDESSTRGLPTPAQYVRDLKRGVEELYVYGSFKRLRRWALRYHMIGGTQIERTLAGFEASVAGAVHDVTGKELFKVEGAGEVARAIVAGPWGTKAGMQYWKDREEKQDESSSWSRKRDRRKESNKKLRTLDSGKTNRLKSL